MRLLEMALHKSFVCTGMLLTMACSLSSSVMAQSGHVNPWEKKYIGKLPPIASLTEGMWLKGDLHLHSRHSTESSNNPISKIVAFSKSVGMDYIGITDHDNHVNGDVAHHTWIDPEFKTDSLLLLYGAEWTTTRGHGNTFSAKPYDHQQLYDVRDQRDVVTAGVKKKLGIHLSANHPSGKDHFGYSYDMIESIEVWNSAVWPKNANAIMIWDDMLSSGHKLTGRGGSDAHHGVPDSPEKATKNSVQATANYVGTPTTWVFAKTRTSQGVIDALTNGRVCVSANPYAPRVEFYADLDEDGKMDMMMGDNAKSTGKPVKFRVQLSGNALPDASYTINVIKNGGPFATFQATGKLPVVEFTDTPVTGKRSYYRVVVEGPQTAYPQVPGSMALSENMVALSNPICFNFDPDF
ncbi:CehA/McbA family metallohydrolase [Xanthocytophaga agilis]|uniref:CehA/McbA family metallohydrolase n=1 Tax=Xanthocytophaga agilis TaxID=3048010 RepID=A0AAE3R8E9_9BACT|nr:CehA/McbA family metallohydrolase [Xanthocytophaga agilis]MDJ1502687.1 CehA/McbA family metallohydrolase [Xanthocytophaga agilis]